MSDLIRRSDAIEAYSDIYWIDDRLNLAFREELDKIDEKIRNIPIVEVADRPQGEWIEHKGRTIVRDNNFIDFFPTEYECSNCGLRQATYSINSSLSNYCPNCGARMKGADDE